MKKVENRCSMSLLKYLAQTRPARSFEEPAQGGYCMCIQINDTIPWLDTICQVKLLQSSCAQAEIHKSAAAYFHPIKRVKEEKIRQLRCVQDMDDIVIPLGIQK